jgi:hypothetical protein
MPSSKGRHGRPDSEHQADDEAQAIAERVLARARVYGMRTDATDWAAVGTFVARSQKATAALARAVGDQPLRATPPASGTNGEASTE